MKQEQMLNVFLADKEKIFIVLFKNGLELISKIDSLSQTQGPAHASFELVKPLKLITINIPVQGPQGVGVNSMIRPEPLSQFSRITKFPLDPEDVWTCVPAAKEACDNYIEQTTGFVLASA